MKKFQSLSHCRQCFVVKPTIDQLKIAFLLIIKCFLLAYGLLWTESNCPSKLGFSIATIFLP